jgi:acyl carrier protein
VIDELLDYIRLDLLRQPKRVLTADTPLISSGLVDSFSLVDLGLHIETRYGVTLDPSELTVSSFDSAAQLAALIQSRQ